MEGLDPRLRDGGERYTDTDNNHARVSLEARTANDVVGRLPVLAEAQQHPQHSAVPMSLEAGTAQNLGWRSALPLGQNNQQKQLVQQSDQQVNPSPSGGSGFTPANPPLRRPTQHSNAHIATPQSGSLSYYNNSNLGDSRSPSADNDNTPPPDSAAGVADESIGPVGSSSKRGACVHCSHSKVRCEPSPDNPNRCIRCTKFNRECVVKERVRKRTKKSEDKVAELERKVELLMNQLHNRNVTASWEAPDAQSEPSPAAQQQGANLPAAHDAAHQPNPGGLPPPPIVLASQRRQKRKFSPTADSVREDVREVIRQTFHLQPPPAAASADKASESVDPIDRGILTMDQATQLFTRYTDEMAPHLPGVIFPDGTTAAQVRKAKPVLFLAVMAASSFDLPTTQPALAEELMQTIANKVVVGGQKSLELIQALHVAVMWYWPPEHFERLNFYQLIHMAAVMAVDLGLDHPKLRVGGIKKHLRQHLLQNHPGVFQVDPSSIECRRAWLTSYFLAMNASMALRRRCLIRWDTHMEKSIEVLRTSPEAAPSDPYLCHLVLTHKLAEDIAVQFKIADSYSTIDVNDEMAYVHLRGFEWDLERYRADVAPEDMRPSLLLSFHVLNLYMHETVAQPDQIDEQQQQQPYAAQDLTGAHIRAILACQVAIDGIIDVFLGMDVESIRCLPVFNFVRITFAVVVLIKIYSAASSPNSKLRGAIDAKQLDVTKRLDALLEKFKLAAAKDQSRPANKFLVVLLMFKTWFQQQQQDSGAPGVDRRPSLKGEPSLTPAQTPGLQQQQLQSIQQHTGYPTTAGKNTPLQVLSEVAVNQNDTTTNNTNIPAAQQQQQQQQPTPASTYMMDWAAPTTSTYPDYPSSTIPALDPVQVWSQLDLVLMTAPDFDYSLFAGDPFGQALDLTFGNLGLSGWDNPNLQTPMPPQPGYTADGQVPPVPPHNNGYLSAVLNDMNPASAGNATEAGGNGYQKY